MSKAITDEMTDDFRGDTPHLIRCIEALLSLDASGSLGRGGVGGHARTMLSAAAVRLAALSAGQAQPVAIKPLRWKGPDGHGEYHSLDGMWGYIIRAETGEGFWLTEIGRYYPSTETAKAAAQSDYESRIRAALSAPLPEIEGGDKGDGWQPIETAPNDGTPVLIWVDGHVIEASFDCDECEWVAGVWGLGFDEDASYWQPLPAAPSASIEGETP